MRAQALIEALQALITQHGDLPVVFPMPQSIQSKPVEGVSYDNYHRYWGGTSPNGTPTAIRGKVFLIR